MATLVITSGQLEGRRIEVSRELVIGRENVDVEIEDAELSRRHFAVRPTEGGLEVEDLGSRNGTRVDGTRIDGPTRIRHGAVLSVGMTTFTVDAPPAAAARTQARPRTRARGHRGRPGPAAARADPRRRQPRAAPPPPAGSGRRGRLDGDRAAVRALPGEHEQAQEEGGDPAVAAAGAHVRGGAGTAVGLVLYFA